MAQNETKTPTVIETVYNRFYGNGGFQKLEHCDRHRFLEQLRKCWLSGFKIINGDTTAIALHETIPVLKVLKLKNGYVLEYNETFWTED